MTKTAALVSNRVEVEDSFDDLPEFFELYYKNGWTDGLPVYPPTERAVRAMLVYSDRAPSDPVATLSPAGGVATIEKIAVNACMAGCRPEYLPVIVAAVEAIAHPDYNLYGRQTTTHPGAHLIIINGPIRKELEVNCKGNVFGQGWRANATIGRALRLILTNIGGARPAVVDMATHGHPGKYSYCIGEDEEGSPWSPLHVERGLSPETSSVTVMCAEAPHNVNDQVSKTPELYLESAASTMATLGSNGVYRSGIRGEQGIVLTSESAHWIAEFGWSKDDVKRFLFEKARRSVRELRDRGCWGKIPLPDFIDPVSDSAMVPIVQAPDDLVVLVAGGHQRHMAALLTAGYSLSITRPVAFRDGTPIRSTRDFIQSAATEQIQQNK